MRTTRMGGRRWTGKQAGEDGAIGDVACGKQYDEVLRIAARKRSETIY